MSAATYPKHKPTIIDVTLNQWPSFFFFSVRGCLSLDSSRLTTRVPGIVSLLYNLPFLGSALLPALWHGPRFPAVIAIAPMAGVPVFPQVGMSLSRDRFVYQDFRLRHRHRERDRARQSKCNCKCNYFKFHSRVLSCGIRSLKR